MQPDVHTFVLGDFQTNCFVVSVPTQPEAWIVDCGFEPDAMFRFIDEQRLQPVAILLTHAHSDHIAGLDAARSRYGDIPVYLHEDEEGFCSNPILNLSAMIGLNISMEEPDHWLRDGETLELNGTKWRVMHAPGHSPGCVLFICDEAGVALAGDSIFAGSIGRIDFPTSDPQAMRDSLKRIMTLPDGMRIHPGHGPSTTIGVERRSNPYVRGGW